MEMALLRLMEPGDQVYWNDPDAGACSKWITISTIVELGGDAVGIIDVNGEYTECFAAELT